MDFLVIYNELLLGRSAWKQMRKTRVSGRVKVVHLGVLSKRRTNLLPELLILTCQLSNGVGLLQKKKK